MKHLPINQISNLRQPGYPLSGENWRSVSRHFYPESGLSIVKIINGDTLAIVYIPVDILTVTDISFPEPLHSPLPTEI